MIRWARRWWRTAAFLTAMWRWKRGTTPAWKHRKLLIAFADRAPDEVRARFDHLAGPALLAGIAEKTRRRRMAIWQIRASMTAAERLEAFTRKLERLTRALEAEE